MKMSEKAGIYTKILPQIDVMNEPVSSTRIRELISDGKTFEAQKYLAAFQPKDDAVVLADFAHYDVQNLLKESKLLITDYSSVFFDVAYMGKPCVYYQFDREKFYSSHYQKGYFDYDTMGFGEVALSHEELIDVVVRYIQTGFWVKDEYKGRTDSFFPVRDQNNCKRIMDEILKL